MSMEGREERCANTVNKRICRTVKTLCMIPWRGIHVIIHLSEATECIMLKLNHKTMDAGSLSCVSNPLSMVPNAQFWWGMLMMGEAINVWEQKVYGKYFPSPQFC